jgi:hypothetical protein
MINGADWLQRFPTDIRNQAASLIAALEQSSDLVTAKALIDLVAHQMPDLAIELALTLLSPISPLQAALTAGELCVAINALDPAHDLAVQALDTVPDDPDAWGLMARVLWRKDWKSAAASAITRAVRAGYDFSALEPIELKLIALAAVGESDARLAQIVRPCALLGPFSRSTAGKSDVIISRLLEAHLQSFERDPPQIPGAKLAQGLSSSSGLRVLLVQNEFIGGDQNRIRNDVADIFANSALAFGMDVHRSAAAHLLLHDDQNARSDNEFVRGLSLLQFEIETLQPNLILMDGNFIGRDRTLTPNYFTGPGRGNYRLVVTIPDLYDAQPNNLFDYWGACADAVVYFNQRTTHVATTQHRDKGFYWPGLPFDPAMLAHDSQQQLVHDFCLIGSNGRSRDLYARILQDMGFGGFYRLHRRSNAQAVSVEAYRRELAAARLVFNNGFNSNTESIVTGRVFEAIYSGAVLLEESGSDIDQLFAPFVHYIPIAGVHQLMHFADFMIRHDDERSQIAKRAKDFAARHYAGKYFWSALLNKLGF